jgi:hypothetical protein
VLGRNAGGLITNLLKAKGKNVALARAAIEQASQTADPREYVSAIIKKRSTADNEADRAFQDWASGRDGFG